MSCLAVTFTTLQNLVFLWIHWHFLSLIQLMIEIMFWRIPHVWTFQNLMSYLSEVISRFNSYISLLFVYVFFYSAVYNRFEPWTSSFCSLRIIQLLIHHRPGLSIGYKRFPLPFPFFSLVDLS